MRLTQAQQTPLYHGAPPPHATGWGQDAGRPFITVAAGDQPLTMRWIPPGDFLMGSPESEQGRWEDEGPQARVRLSQGLWLGQTPVTQAQWFAVMGTEVSYFRGPERPVEQVPWLDAVRFCNTLSSQTGLSPAYFQDPDHQRPYTEGEQAFWRPSATGYRLPTEAEWECACRAGTHTARWSDAPLDTLAWFTDNSDGRTHDVGQKLANPWGLHDMLGNVWEWCGDTRGIYTDLLRTDPFVETGPVRVSRGGSWGFSSRYARAAYRYWNHPGDRYRNLGFRLAQGPAAGGPAQPSSQAAARDEPEQAQRGAKR